MVNIATWPEILRIVFCSFCEDEDDEVCTCVRACVRSCVRACECTLVCIRMHVGVSMCECARMCLFVLCVSECFL